MMGLPLLPGTKGVNLDEIRPNADHPPSSGFTTLPLRISKHHHRIADFYVGVNFRKELQGGDSIRHRQSKNISPNRQSPLLGSTRPPSIGNILPANCHT